MAAPMATLQWSRRLSATETAVAVGPHEVAHLASMQPSPLSDGDAPGTPPHHDCSGAASMEPSPLSDGDHRWQAHSMWVSILLQWSRRLSATETAGRRPTNVRRCRWLQWSRRLSATETS